MEETLIMLLQQRMDKCTNEQFWAVASLTAADSFVVSEWSHINGALPVLLILSCLTLASVYGAWFVIARHRSYYRNRQALAELLKSVQNAPDFMKKKSELNANTLSGVSFFVMWIIFGWLLCVGRALAMSQSVV